MSSKGGLSSGRSCQHAFMRVVKPSGMSGGTCGLWPVMILKKTCTQAQIRTCVCAATGLSNSPELCQCFRHSSKWLQLNVLRMRSEHLPQWLVQSWLHALEQSLYAATAMLATL